MCVFSNKGTALISLEGGKEKGVHEILLFHKESDIFIGVRRITWIKYLMEVLGSANGESRRVESAECAIILKDRIGRRITLNSLQKQWFLSSFQLISPDRSTVLLLDKSSERLYYCWKNSVSVFLVLLRNPGRNYSTTCCHLYTLSPFFHRSSIIRGATRSL